MRRYRPLELAVVSVCAMLVAGCTGVGNIDSAEQLGLSAVPQSTSDPLPTPAKPDAFVDKTPEISAPAAPVYIEEPASSDPKPLPDDDLYSGLPTGPNNTGTFPEFSGQPSARIIDPSEAEVQQIIAKLEALEAAQRAGAVSPAQYNARLAALRQLARNHSPAMLTRIESRR